MKTLSKTSLFSLILGTSTALCVSSSLQAAPRPGLAWPVELSHQSSKTPFPANTSSTDKMPTEATLVGFRKTGEKSALVYVQLTDIVKVRKSREKNTFTFTLLNTKVNTRNNQNPLLASHFNSAVKNAQLVAAGKNVKLVIELSREANMSIRLDKESSSAVLYVEFTEK